jgi:hypothetical protein
MLGACAAARPVVLEIGSPAGDAVYARHAVRPGDTLTYRFIHSVSRTPVEETWEVVDGPSGPGLRLRRILYQATGAGLPSAPDMPDATVEATGDGFVVKGLDRAIGLPLDLRVTPSAENAITVGGETIDLTHLPSASGSGSASLVRLTLR